MQNLPAGWQVSNSTGSWSAPAEEWEDDHEHDPQAEAGLEPEDLRPDSPGWEDVEEDTEELAFKSFFDDRRFSSLKEMLDYTAEEHDFDVLDYVKRFDLDFYSTIKFVNFIRRSVAEGLTARLIHPDDASEFADDEFLKPVLEDDAVLFNLYDVLDEPTDESAAPVEANGGADHEGSGHREAAKRALA